MVQEGKSFIKVLVNESQVQCTLSHRQLSQPLSVHLVLSSTPPNHCPLKKKKKLDHYWCKLCAMNMGKGFLHPPLGLSLVILAPSLLSHMLG